MDVNETQRTLTQVTGSCGHTRGAMISLDPQRAATEIEQLVTGPCTPCVKAERGSLRNLTWRDVR